MTNATSKEENPLQTYSAPIEQVVVRENMMRTYLRVVTKKGADRIDKMAVEDLGGRLKKAWAKNKEAILSGNYEPQAVKRVRIPKLSGGKRELEIPMVTDRLIQQATAQVLEPIFGREFSEFRFGFRKRKSAQAQPRGDR